ncbi:class F sortase [Amycolatopsis sp. NPDC059021]|uniref:class F sortase n=1 Tax=Amycolatopsis sp. NPDC059021 TaxID=3346704 RepID=UPI00366D866C
MVLVTGRRLATGFVLGAVSVLAVELVAAAIVRPPTTMVAGTAEAAPAAVSAAKGSPAVPSAPSTSSPPPATSSSAPASPAAQPPSPPTPQPQRPGTIRLPGGGTAAMVRKNLGPNAELPIPDNIGEAAWWGADLTAAGGASVFAGHVNWRGAIGPFAELWDEKIGGEITVVDARGKTWRYKISQLVTVHKNDLPQRADELFGPSGPHRVVLVTCGGRWVGGPQGYEENRVAVADPV